MNKNQITKLDFKKKIGNFRPPFPREFLKQFISSVHIKKTTCLQLSFRSVSRLSSAPDHPQNAYGPDKRGELSEAQASSFCNLSLWVFPFSPV